MKLNNKTKECKILITFFSVIICLYYLKIPVICLFHKITKLYCPGCGVTRMFDALIHLNFKAAISYNAFVFCLLIMLFIYTLLNLVRYLLKKPVYKIPTFVFYLLIILAILFAVVRNIPTFSSLAP